MPLTLWLIPLLPLLSFLVVVFLTWRTPRLSGYVTILAIGGSFILALLVFQETLALQQAAIATGASAGPVTAILRWYQVGDATLEIGVLVDPLAAIMLLVVTAVSLLVQIYSQGYMAHDPGYSRYFAFMSLFTFSMLGLVLAPNFLQMFIFWELVGVSSYLLIGFWYQRPEAAFAAKKAFVTTRLGDLGFLIGILILFAQTGTFDFGGIEQAVAAGRIALSVLSVAMVLIFLGAVGKSAQFPLHVWLPDAMEGPTPVSALIHAATMVAAGVYLVARTFPLFEAAPSALFIVAVVGGFTAFFAATMGLVAEDIKRVLAYSTVSQLGYMMLALGVGAFSAGMFHLFTHAFFKALLFLAAGAVIYGTAPPGSNHGEQSLFRLGGLRRQMPWTAFTFAIGGLALAGIPPLAGFWSKDEILVATLHSGQVGLLVLALLTVLLTAFYITRAWLLAFWGERRVSDAASASVGDRHASAHAAGYADEQHAHAASGAHHGEAVFAGESPWVMVGPLVVLVVPSVLVGFLGSPLTNNWFGTFLHGGEPEPMAVEPAMLTASVLLAALGIVSGYLVYGARVVSAEALTATFRPIHTLLVNKYYVDHLYYWLVSRVFLGLSLGLAWIDRHVIDGFVNLVAWLSSQIGRGVTATETGRVPNYALAVFAGVVAIAVALYVVRPMP